MSSLTDNEDPSDQLLAVFDRLANRRIVVAFSGGVDSGVVLAAATRVRPRENVLAVMVSSPAVPTTDIALAERFAAECGVAFQLLAGQELERRGYRTNGRDRCAHCKSELMAVIAQFQSRQPNYDRDHTTVVTGTNADDRQDPHRPGIAAADSAGARTPLADAGISKEQVRRVARHWGLSVADKPQSACLASRIAHGVPVTAAGLRRVDAAETGLRQLFDQVDIPVRNLRVRDLGDDRARVDVDVEWVDRLPAISGRITERLTDCGFAQVRINPAGFASGSMNLLPLRVVGSGPASG